MITGKHSLAVLFTETRPTGVYTTLPGQRIKKMSLPSDPVEFDMQSLSPARYVPFSPSRQLPKSIPDRLDHIARQSSEPSSLDNSRNNLVSLSPNNECESEETPDSPAHQVVFFIESPTDSGHLPALYPPKTTCNIAQAHRRKSSPGGIGFIPNSAKAMLIPSQDSYHTRSPARKTSPSVPSAGDYHLKTELPVYAVISELMKVAETMRMKSSEMKMGDKLRYRHNHTSFEVAVTKTRLDNSCTLHFEWLSGGTHRSFQDICQEVVQRITV